jgi:uncharacterized membrane protein
MGIIYVGLEILYRGYSSYWMILVGGLCSFLVGRLNEKPLFFERKMWQQCLTGTVITIGIEFISGIILNVWLGLNIWDYSDMKYNLYGVICPQFGLLWFVLMPLCIYIDDWLRWKIFNEEKPSGLFEYYKDLIMGR